MWETSVNVCHDAHASLLSTLPDHAVGTVWCIACSLKRQRLPSIATFRTKRMHTRALNSPPGHISLQPEARRRPKGPSSQVRTCSASKLHMPYGPSATSASPSAVVPDTAFTYTTYEAAAGQQQHNNSNSNSTAGGNNQGEAQVSADAPVCWGLPGVTASCCRRCTCLQPLQAMP